MTEERYTLAEVLNLTLPRFIVAMVFALIMAYVLVMLSREVGWLVVGVIIMGLTIPASYLIRRGRESAAKEQEGSEVNEGSGDRDKGSGQEESP